MAAKTKPRCVITGGVGSGKTTIVNALREDRRIWIGDEKAIDIVKEQLASGGSLLPWIKPSEFWKPITQIRINLFETCPIHTYCCIFDRGIPDPIGFLKLEGINPPDELIFASMKYRYDIIFWTPPWKEIYVNTPERPQTWNEAESLGILLRQAYESIGYKTVEIPKGSVEYRSNFIKQSIRESTEG